MTRPVDAPTPRLPAPAAAPVPSMPVAPAAPPPSDDGLSAALPASLTRATGAHGLALQSQAFAKHAGLQQVAAAQPKLTHIYTLQGDSMQLQVSKALQVGSYGKFRLGLDVAEPACLLAVRTLLVHAGDAVPRRPVGKVQYTSAGAYTRELQALRATQAPVQPRHVFAVATANPQVHKVFWSMPLMAGDMAHATQIMHRTQAAERVPAALLMLAQSSDEVQRMHAAGYVHGDLKPANLVFDHAGAVHVIDFGHARPLTAGAAPGVGGTLEYAAPEALAQGHRGPAADVYALGLCFADMLLGRLLVRGSGAVGSAQQADNVRAAVAALASWIKGARRDAAGNIDLTQLPQRPMMQMLISGKFAELCKQHPQASQFVFSRMLHPDPAQRADMAEVGVQMRALLGSAGAARAGQALAQLRPMAAERALAAAGLQAFAEAQAQAQAANRPAKPEPLPGSDTTSACAAAATLGASLSALRLSEPAAAG